MCRLRPTLKSRQQNFLLQLAGLEIPSTQCPFLLTFLPSSWWWVSLSHGYRENCWCGKRLETCNMILKISRMLRVALKNIRKSHTLRFTPFLCGFKFIWSRARRWSKNKWGKVRLAPGEMLLLPLLLSPVAFSHPHERTLIFYVTLCELTKLNWWCTQGVHTLGQNRQNGNSLSFVWVCCGTVWRAPGADWLFNHMENVSWLC